MLGKDIHKTLPKSERLASKKIIDRLFTEGITFTGYPFVIKYLPLVAEEAKSHQVLFTASKRNFKKAVERNKIKRRMREAYRLNKSMLDTLPKKYALAYLYTAKKILPYKELESKLIKTLLRLQKELS